VVATQIIVDFHPLSAKNDPIWLYNIFYTSTRNVW